MVDAIGVVSIERGIDPRPLLLVAGGGGGALHAGKLAADIGIRRVLVPAEAGTLSAFGMTVSDVRHDYTRALHTYSAEPALGEIRAAISEMDDEAAAELERAGFEGVRVRLTHYVDVRYVGQVHELTVPMDVRYVGQVHELTVPIRSSEIDADALAVIGESFHRLHHERYGWSAPERVLEFLHWRTAGTGLIDVPIESRFASLASTSPDQALTGSRNAYFDALGGFVDTPAYAGSRFPAGGELIGPALIDCATTTIVVHPDQRLVGDGRGSFLIETT
jgi:N-methylhydantoinase A